MLMFQVFVNVGMNIGIMPITGIPLPLMSYGGSSVLTTLIAVGLLQSIYAQGRAAASTRDASPLPEGPHHRMRKQVLVSVDRGETRVALLEATGQPDSLQGRRGRKKDAAAGYRVAELYLERRGNRSIVGNIYKGKVDNVLPGLEAAFVDIGLDKNGFLHVDEIVLPGVETPRRGRGKEGGKKITDLLKPGQEIVVQVVKDPLKTKGARLSMELTIAGRYMVYAPTGEGVGVSKRLDDKERERLRSEAKGLDLTGGGAIIRTAAQGAKRAGLRARAAVPVQAQRGAPQARRGGHGAPAMVFQEADLSVRVVRDIFSADFERAIVDDEKQHHRLVSFFTRTAPELVDRVELYEDAKTPLFEEYGVEKVIDGLMGRRVDLPSGGYLHDRLRRGADGHRRQLRLVRRPRQAGPPGGHDHARRTSRRPRRSSTSCGCATSAASSSSTSSTWPARATATPS